MTQPETLVGIDRALAIVFLHIPKTAGMTLYQIINRRYKRGASSQWEG